MAFLASVLNLALGIVFAVAAIPKLRTPSRFVAEFRRTTHLPTAVSDLAATLLLSAEGLLALFHLSGRLPLSSGVLGIITLLTMLGGVGFMLLKGWDGPCLCFDIEGHDSVSTATALRLASMLAAEIILLFLQGNGVVAEAVAPLAVATALAIVTASAWILSASAWTRFMKSSLPRLGFLS